MLSVEPIVFVLFIILSVSFRSFNIFLNFGLWTSVPLSKYLLMVSIADFDINVSSKVAKTEAKFDLPMPFSPYIKINFLGVPLLFVRSTSKSTSDL